MRITVKYNNTEITIEEARGIDYNTSIRFSDQNKMIEKTIKYMVEEVKKLEANELIKQT